MPDTSSILHADLAIAVSHYILSPRRLLTWQIQSLANELSTRTKERDDLSNTLSNQTAERDEAIAKEREATDSHEECVRLLEEARLREEALAMEIERLKMAQSSRIN
jgi:hypothetical protein